MGTGTLVVLFVIGAVCTAGIVYAATAPSTAGGSGGSPAARRPITAAIAREIIAHPQARRGRAHF
jgi:hypothetical protein